MNLFGWKSGSCFSNVLFVVFEVDSFLLLLNTKGETTKQMILNNL